MQNFGIFEVEPAAGRLAASTFIKHIPAELWLITIKRNRSRWRLIGHYPASAWVSAEQTGCCQRGQKVKGSDDCVRSPELSSFAASQPWEWQQTWTQISLRWKTKSSDWWGAQTWEWTREQKTKKKLQIVSLSPVGGSGIGRGWPNLRVWTGRGFNSGALVRSLVTLPQEIIGFLQRAWWQTRLLRLVCSGNQTFERKHKLKRF